MLVAPRPGAGNDGATTRAVARRKPGGTAAFAGGAFPTLAVLCLLAALPTHALNAKVLIDGLQLPKINLNLNITFSTGDLRVPESADPQGDIARLLEQVKLGARPDLHLKLARLYMMVGKGDEAATQFQLAVAAYGRLLDQDPKNAQARVEYAEALIALGDDENAADQIERALILDENLAKAHELSADLHAKHAVLAYNQGQDGLMRAHLEAAELEATEATKLSPQDPRPLLMLFVVRWLPAVFELRDNPLSGLEKLSGYEELSGILHKAATLAPEVPRLRQYAIACRLLPFFAAQMVKGLDKPLWGELNDNQKRVLSGCRDEYLALAQDLPELKADALMFAGVTSFIMGDRTALYQQLQDAANADPKRTEALEVTVGFLAHEGKWSEALQAVEEIRKRRPSARAYTWQGRIYAELGQWEQAETAFRLATSYPDADSTAYLGLGVVLLRSGADPAEALGPLRTAWEQGQDEPEVLLAWGVVLALVGEVEEGKRYVSQALSLWPPSPALRPLAREFGLEPPA